MKTGDKVIVVSAQHGWGTVVKGDIGVIIKTDKDNNRLYLDIVGKCPDWIASYDDVELADERVLQSCQATIFVNRMREQFNDDLAVVRRAYDVNDKRIKELEKRVNVPIPDTDIFTRIKDRVEKVIFRDNKMYMTTKECYIDYRPRAISKTLHIYVGKFEVLVDFITEQMSMTQLEPRCYLHSSYDHPHITGHQPCLGTYHEPLRKAIKCLDICAVMSMILDYLNSCANPGWYISILAWLTNEQRREYNLEEICERCEQYMDNCECDRCGHCDRDTDNCECVYCESCDSYDDNCNCLRCPDSNERLEDNNFPDSSCGQCSCLCKNIASGNWECRYDSSNVYYDLPLDDYEPPLRNANFRFISRDGTRYTHEQYVELMQMEEQETKG